MTNKKNSCQKRDFKGFSLIEVLIAVVVLATGLLALTALQGRLAQNSADAKARSAIMSALTSRMSLLRQAPGADGVTSIVCTAGNWVCDAQIQANTGALTIAQTIATLLWKGGTFQAPAAGDDLSGANMKRVSLAASWIDARGATRLLALQSDVSGRIYGVGTGYPSPDPNSSAAKRPIFRQANPSNIPGVIPLVSGNQASAASNPQPIKLGTSNFVGTAFDVLNYIPEGGNATAKIIKRFQTEVVKCTCKYGAGGGYSVAGEAQWPVTWDGTTYTAYAGSGAPTGLSANAGQNPADTSSQSSECTECCRDQHDSSSTPAEGRFDPEATGVSKYYPDNKGQLIPVATGVYLAACRVVKLEGIWKTAADLYARQVGLLETKSVAGVQARSGIPKSKASPGDPDEATEKYQTFVKDYLAQYTGSSTTAPVGAQAMFDDTARGLNNPLKIDIPAPSSIDERYLHLRGLYVDYLGTAAKKAVGDAISQCGSGVALAECILPVLPFTTINLTETAAWQANDATILTVNTLKALNWNVDQPSGGRTKGKAVGSANTASTVRLSNSGVAVSDKIPGAVDDVGDLLTSGDSQAFVVGGGGSGGGNSIDTFNVAITGGGGGTGPGVSSNLAPNGCSYSGPATAFVCDSTNKLPQNGTITLSNYFRVQRFATDIFYFPAGSCISTDVNTPFVAGNYTIPAENAHAAGLPKLFNQDVTGVALNGTALTGPWPATRNVDLANEETDTLVANIPAPSPTVATISVTLKDKVDSSPLLPTIKSCTWSPGKSNNKPPPSITSVTWNEAWAN